MTISEQRRIAMRSCLDALSQYAAIAAHFPPQAALRQHRESIWSNRLQQMMDGLINLDITAVRNEVTKSKAKETLIAQVSREPVLLIVEKCIDNCIRWLN